MTTVYVKYNNNFYTEDLNPELPLKQLFDLIEKKFSIQIENTHNIYMNSKQLNDNETVKNIELNKCVLNVQYSLGKSLKNIPDDTIGKTNYLKLLDELGKKSDEYTLNIISLLSFNITDHNIKKNLLQQTQFELINKLLKYNPIIRKINIILCDNNFTEYNLNYEYKNHQVKQIHDLIEIKRNEKFNSKDYLNRIIKFSTLSNNILLKNLIKSKYKIKINFFYVGINFNSKIKNDISNYIVYGINYSKLVNKNFFVNMWTGDELLSC